MSHATTPKTNPYFEGHARAFSHFLFGGRDRVEVGVTAILFRNSVAGNRKGPIKLVRSPGTLRLVLKDVKEVCAALERNEKKGR
ncbi:hypothetical protein ZHAS_00005849 [Anopheles sinensis]|uniref:Uncharacterized protein n=1 Tax=Anopheles sinensis TaxID=74873 RepID=A0A084VKF7_ANOSI|nr:hypothetical protein ZHAS_00005849 [Anopheles sinensis]